ncbi:MAG: hypothetical protein ACOX3J_12015 [Clostridia bacterium]|jgi:hypothetical protein|nr:hypothetical protein [Clostridiaceae bacterium]
MNRGILLTVCIFAIVVLVVVAGFFLLDIEKVALSYWGFGSLLFSLAVSMLAAITILLPKKRRNAVFYSFGLSSATTLYLTAIIVGLIASKAFEKNLNGFILLQVIIHSLFIITAIIIFLASEHIRNKNVETQKKLDSGEYDRPKRGGF